tara:strand:- start:289 stop:510 length:222 start_codon:yes stop_codon:yes gene_type:complete
LKIKGIKQNNYSPKRNSNAPIAVRVIDRKTKAIIGDYNSLSEAANSMESAAANLSKAIKNNGVHKGYIFKKLL